MKQIKDDKLNYNISKSNLIKIDHHYHKCTRHLLRHRLGVKKCKQQYNNYKTTIVLDHIKVELLKHAAENIAKEVATIYTERARTRENPNEINQGVITTIQRPSKAKKAIENLGLIASLYMLKILRVCF